jgi:protein TonB
MSSRIVTSSGSATLDRETLALVQRVQPFPPPPPELVGSELIWVLQFRIR